MATFEIEEPPPPKKKGRPPLAFPEGTENVVQKSAYNGGSDKEIAALIGCSISVLYAHFRIELMKHRAMRKIDVREWQTNTARAGNPALLIWIGKQELEQRDYFEPDLTDKDLDSMTDAQLEEMAKGRPRLRIVRGRKRA